MHTRKNMFPMLRKRKRIIRTVKTLYKGFTQSLQCHLQRIWMVFNYTESTILAGYTVRAAQPGIVSMQTIQSTLYFLTLHSSTRGTCCLSLLHSLPASMLHPTLFLSRKLSPRSSSAYGSSSQGLLTSHQLSQGGQQKNNTFFSKFKGEKKNQQQ